MNNRRVLWGVILLVAAVLLTPGYFIARTYGLFQHEVVLTKYQLAVDVDGEQVDAWPLLAGFAATDKKGELRPLYYRLEGSDLNMLYQLAYGQFEVEASEDNLFLAGRVQYDHLENDYIETRKEYVNAKEYRQDIIFYNDRKEPIFTYDPAAKADGDMVKEIITAGMTRSNGQGGSGVVEDKYLNVTRLFEEKLGISMRVQVDKERRLATIHMEQLK
ncbi:Uncharacterised protein [Actinobacillus pleuropneumoniae]|nr:Uncharacterised protein [Actinobacillus pleuropneumoniae]